MLQEMIDINYLPVYENVSRERVTDNEECQ